MLEYKWTPKLYLPRVYWLCEHQIAGQALMNKKWKKKRQAMPWPRLVTCVVWVVPWPEPEIFTSDLRWLLHNLLLPLVLYLLNLRRQFRWSWAAGRLRFFFHQFGHSPFPLQICLRTMKQLLIHIAWYYCSLELR